MDFPEAAINHKSQWEFQLIISGILGHHNQKSPMNLHFKFFLLIYLLKEPIMLWKFYINLTVYICVEMTSYWSETIFVISLSKNIVLAELFETSFDSNILASFTELQRRGTDTFGFIRVQTFQICILGNFLHK